MIYLIWMVLQVKNKTIIGLKFENDDGDYVINQVKNKTIIGLK